MSSTRDRNELRGFCNAQTQEKALELLPLARSKAGQTSGYNVPVNAFIPICAYLASQHLQNNDVDMEAARNKASMSATLFKQNCDIIRRVLESQLAGKKRRGKVTYEGLIEEHISSSSEKLPEWLARVEDGLAGMKKTYFNRNSSETKCAVFFWVYGVLEDRNVPLKEIVGSYKVDENKTKVLLSDLGRYFRDIRKEISDYARFARSNSASKVPLPPTTPRTSPRKSPNKRVLREVITGDSPKKLRVAEADTNTEKQPPSLSSPEPVAGSSKDVDMAPPPKTPSRRNMGPFPEHVTPSSRDTLNMLAEKGKVSTSPSRMSTRKTPATTTTSTARPLPISLLVEPTPYTPTRSSRRIAVAQATAEPASPWSRQRGSPRKISLVDEDAMDVDAPSSEDEEESIPEAPIGRRYRPVFQDRRQWDDGCPGLHLLWKRAQETNRQRIKKHGYPFEQYRPVTEDGTMDNLFG
ncbi:hypothetical protein Moror_1522 [Moniliophthora roreri MCA 2997]|uniref:Uncharacterized protein n=2 Tax=Moniliophthora roreri TaxID=221103 RepID=V2YPN7_MONRO|nr:hypothetical protein Moror_1522 [Moniliophthora roreri MCA 2997]KAI3609598.1 hypothetical protein WG66_001200 [Moniliophthora roreri]